MYEAVKIVHILSWTSWMAGLFYLPRIFVYHAERGGGSVHTAETLAIMAAKLHRLIMTPAMLSTWATGLYLGVASGALAGLQPWLLAKLALVLGLTAFHLRSDRWRRELAEGTNRRSGRFYRIANEAPTLVFVAVIVLIVLRPA